MPRTTFNLQPRTEKVIYHAWADVEGVDDLPPIRTIEQDGSPTLIELERSFGESVDKDSLRYFRTTVVTTVQSVEVNSKGRVMGNGTRTVTRRRPYPNAPNRLI
jgi:hypothetical protein